MNEVKDAELCYVLVNRQWERLFHRKNEEVVGKTVYDVFPREFAERLDASSQRVLKSGKPAEEEEVVPQDDGPHTYITLKVPLLDDSGAAYAVCGIATDVTARKQAEEQARHLQTALAHAGRLTALGGMAAGLAHELN